MSDTGWGALVHRAHPWENRVLMKHALSWHLPHFSLSLDSLVPSDERARFASAFDSGAPRWHAAVQQHFRSGKVGFYDWPVDAEGSLAKASHEIAKKLRSETHGALMLGIGGSALGPVAAEEALRSPDDRDKYPLHWVANVDAEAMERAVRFAKARKCALVVTSKSGGTIETMAALFKLLPLVDEKHVVAVTDEKTGFLRELATARKWTTLPVPANVGGRYSVLTAVGALPMALCGIDVEQVLGGARAMRTALEGKTGYENPALVLAAAKHFADSELKRPVQYLMAYRSSLERFADWYVQLWAESLGQQRRTDKKPVGPTPVAAVGSADQHSVLQLLRQGPGDKVVGFLSVVDRASDATVPAPPFPAGPLAYLVGQRYADLVSEASYAVEKSLGNGGTPTYRLHLPQLDAAALGALFFFFETACAYGGECYDVAAFDQPGVEETKILWRAALERAK